MNESEMNQRISELEAENAELKKRHKEKSEFLSMVAHQLRTPLSGIKWTFKMLLDDKSYCVTEEQKSFLQKGMDSNERMIRLLKEVMVADQNENWKFSYHFKPLDLSHLVDQMVSEFQQEAKAHKVHINFDPQESSKNILVRADKDKIILVLENLLENAIKYNESYGTVDLTISKYQTKGPDTHQEFLKLSIHNTGLSIPLEEQPKLFSKFFRASNARKKIQTGTGLGLFTSKQVVEQHGGGIWFDSKEGEGTTFHVTLPTVKTQIGSLSTSHHLHPDIQYRT